MAILFIIRKQGEGSKGLPAPDGNDYFRNRMKNMTGFLLRLGVLTIGTMAIYHFAASWIPQKWYYVDFWWLPVFIAVVTAVLHAGLIRRQHDSKAFIRFYMGTTGIKLFIYLTIIMVVAFINKQLALPFALCFFFFYFCFTAFEVSGALKNFGGSTTSSHKQ
jgi:hypothetical protein